MKPLLMTLSGIGLSVAMFSGGLIAATAYFEAEPERQLSLLTDETGVWTDQPVRVNAKVQPFERVPAQPVAQQALPKAPQQQDAAPGQLANDPGTQVASLQAPVQPQDTASEANSAHVAWCLQRYRSYRADDNSYQPYNGRRRECISPYLDQADASPGGPPATAEQRDLMEASYEPDARPIEIGYYAEQAMPSADHVEYCFSRYRSYRPEDNSYQPYNGGPRRPCL